MANKEDNKQNNHKQKKSTLTTTREVLGIVKNVLGIIFFAILIFVTLSIYSSVKSGEIFQNLPFGGGGMSIEDLVRGGQFGDDSSMKEPVGDAFDLSLQNILKNMKRSFEDGDTSASLNFLSQVEDAAMREGVDIGDAVTELDKAIRIRDSEAFYELVAELERR